MAALTHAISRPNHWERDISVGYGNRTPKSAPLLAGQSSVSCFEKSVRTYALLFIMKMHPFTAVAFENITSQ